MAQLSAYFQEDANAGQMLSNAVMTQTARMGDFRQRNQPQGEIDLLAKRGEPTTPADPEKGEVFRCQATEATRATTAMPEMAVGQYVREVRVGNIGVPELVRVGSSALVTKLARKAGLRPYLPLEVAGKDRVDGEKLGLQPGDWVRVRSKEEIGRTLNSGGAHRGMLFTHEMVQYCGQTFRVHQRVERLINEQTGELLQMKQECIALEDVICKGHYTAGAWFCAREHLPLWREDWLSGLPEHKLLTRKASQAGLALIFLLCE